MDDAVIKQFEFAQEYTDQILTLSTGLLGLTILVTKDVAPGRAYRKLVTCWVMLVLSMCFGILALGALTGELTQPEPDVWGSPRLYSLMQWILFVGGAISALAYKAAAMREGLS